MLKKSKNKSILLGLFAIIILGSIPALAKKESKEFIKASYEKACLQIPAIGNKKGREAFCDCMAKGHMKKGLTLAKVQALDDFYSGRVKEGEDDQTLLLINFDGELSEICAKHLIK